MAELTDPRIDAVTLWLLDRHPMMVPAWPAVRIAQMLAAADSADPVRRHPSSLFAEIQRLRLVVRINLLRHVPSATNITIDAILDEGSVNG